MVCVFFLFYEPFQVDDVLSMFNKQSKDKKRNIILVVSIFLAMTGMVILDVIAKIRNANIYKDRQEQRTIPNEF